MSISGRQLGARLPIVLCSIAAALAGAGPGPVEPPAMNAAEQQLTRGPGGRILTHVNVWSPDSAWVIYDTRSDPAGTVFDGTRVERVNVRSGEVRTVYTSRNGAHCGVATVHPRTDRVAFILGPEHPTPDWQYNAYHRQGVLVDLDRPGELLNLDARDLVPPFTPGALRGGSHVHVWDAAGDWVSFTYEDAVLAALPGGGAHDLNQRAVGVSAPIRPVRVPATHPRNHDGQYFSVLATRTAAQPRPGSDDIQRACEEAWIGTNGYVRPDGARQRRALAFQGEVIAPGGKVVAEVFVADLPSDLAKPGKRPLEGTATQMPAPPDGTLQRRLTYTADRPHPGIQGPRHWLRSAPDGSRIAFLMRDDAGIVQLWCVSPNGGAPVQLTRNALGIASAFTWSPDGRWIAHIMDRSVCLTAADSGKTLRLTPRADAASAPRPEACVFSPDGTRIAYLRRMPSPEEPANQVFCVRFDP